MRPSVIRTDARNVAYHNCPHLKGRVTRSHPLRGKVGQLAAVARVQLLPYFAGFANMGC
jgi:hypothetical protein